MSLLSARRRRLVQFQRFVRLCSVFFRFFFIFFLLILVRESHVMTFTAHYKVDILSLIHI